MNAIARPERSPTTLSVLSSNRHPHNAITVLSEPGFELPRYDGHLFLWAKQGGESWRRTEGGIHPSTGSRWSRGAGGVARVARRDGRRDGVDGGVLASGVGGAGGRLPAAQGELRAPRGDPRPSGPDAAAQDAGAGLVRDHHRFLLCRHLDMIDELDRQIAMIEARILAETNRPFRGGPRPAGERFGGRTAVGGGDSGGDRR